MSLPPLPLAELSAAFRQRGELVARFAPGAAEAFEFCAEWLDASLAAHLDAFLSLDEAAREAEWSYEGLRRRLHDEPSLNAGEPGAPLIRRADLPRLGAPRGPRGPYGPRKPRSARAVEDRSVPPEAPRQDRSVPAGGAEVRKDTDPGIAINVDDETKVDADEHDAPGAADIPADERAVPGMVTLERAPKKQDSDAARKRPIRPPPRRRSRKERFTELLALASRT